MSDTTKTFAKDMAELEAITAWFEGSDIDLDEALAKFERGMELASGLKKQLGEVENKIEKIKKSFE
jgi:exodeoxyribonuclease VII small subunit